MCKINNSRKSDEIVKDYCSEIAIDSIDSIDQVLMVKLCLLLYLYSLSNTHKRTSDEEYHKNDHVDDRLKRKHGEKRHDEEHHKRDHVNDRLKRKQTEKPHNEKYHKRIHVDDGIKRNQDKEHHKKNHNDNPIKRKYDINYYREMEVFNSIKTNSRRNNNYGPLENNVEDKNRDLYKGDRLESENYTCFEELYNEEFLEENHNIIAKEEPSKGIHKNQVDEVTIVNCKTTVTSEMIPVCENIPHTSEITVEPVTVKIPVVLTECTVTITVMSSLKLEDTILEIKHIRKNVYLNQCKLVPNSESGKPNTGILFIDGFIRKHIEYTTKEHNYKEVSCGKIKHVTVKVPFKCTTRVTFKTQPKFKLNTSQDEVEMLESNIKVFDSCEEDINGRDIREQSFKIVQFLNEKVFCELISVEIIESDILENSINKECETALEQGFHEISEKVVLSLTIKLLQNQHVEISKKD